MKLALIFLLVINVQNCFAKSFFDSLKSIFVSEPTTAASDANATAAKDDLEKPPMILKSKSELHGSDGMASFDSETQYDQLKKEEAMALMSNSRASNTTIKIMGANDSVTRHKHCVEALEKYFTDEVPLADMRSFLQAQYELTMYKTFGAILTQKIQQSKDGDTQIRNKSIREVLSENIKKMEAGYGKWPAFQKAARSFDASPMSVETFAELLPFLQDYLARDMRLYEKDPGKNFVLNYRDLKMLHVMAEMEGQFTEEEKKAHNYLEKEMEPFLVKLNNVKSDKLYGKNIDKTAADISEIIVKPRLKLVDKFMDNLRLPKECAQERRDLAELYNCSVCYHRNKDTVMSLINMSREVADTLYNSLNKREDLKQQKEINLRAPVFFYGKGSSWGRYE